MNKYWTRAEGNSGRWRGLLPPLMALLALAQVAWSTEVAFHEPGFLEGATWYGDSQLALVTDRNGVWVAAWPAREAPSVNIGTDIDIVYAYSIDNGDTWSMPAPLNTSAEWDIGLDRYCDIATDGNGVWLAVWSCQDDLNLGLGPDADIVYSKGTLVLHQDLITGEYTSTFTWTDPAPVNSDAESDYYVSRKNAIWVSDEHPRIATDGNDMWAVAWKRTYSGCSGPSIAVATYITDDGSWSPYAEVTADPAAHFLDIATGGSTWYIVTGPESSVSCVHLYRGTRSGNDLSWNLQWTFDENPSNLLIPAVATDKLGSWTVVWAAGLARAMTSYSSDDGYNWTAPIALSPDNVRVYTTDIAADGEGNWLAVVDEKERVVGADYEIATHHSTDGQLWIGPQLVNRDSVYDNRFDHECRIASGMGGRWVTAWLCYPISFTSYSDNKVMVAVGDTIPLTVTPRTGLVTSEEGGTTSFTITLDFPPTKEVTIPVYSDPKTDEAVVTSPPIIFATGEYGEQGSKSVQVTGQDDSDNDGDVKYQIVLGPAVSDDPVYNGIDPADVTIVNLDNNDGLPLALVTKISYGVSHDNRDLFVGIYIANQAGTAVGGASVAANLYRENILIRSISGVTNVGGQLQYILKSAKSGTYTTTVTSVVADGLTWDEVTLQNSYVKQ